MSFAHLLVTEPCPVCGLELRPCNRPAHARTHELEQRDRMWVSRDAQDEMVAMYRRGLTLRQIGARTFWDSATVRNVLIANDITIRPPHRGRRRYLPAEDVLRTTQLYGFGYTTREIGELLGLNPGTVLERLHRYGATVRPRGGGSHRSRSRPVGAS